MMALQTFFALLFGLALGSFLNVCISRMPLHKSVVRPRSHCPHCGTPIAARDNIPLLSFALLRGRCRHCHEAISWRYPLVELSVAALSVACLYTDGPGLDGIGATLFCALLVAMAACDLETLRLPDGLTISTLALGIAYRAGDGYLQELPRGAAYALHTGGALAIRGTISALAAALVLLALRWFYWLLRHHQGMGLGDVKLAAAMAAWLGARQMVLVLFLAAVMGALLGGVMAARRRGQPGVRLSQHAVPFGTFLCIAGIYCVFFGRITLQWYLDLFP